MKPSPEELERFIHRTLRALPDRPAPRSLETRVLAALAARRALPWWKQSYAQWPLMARCAFLIGSGAIAKFALMAAMWLWSGPESAHVSGVVAAELARFERVGAVFARTGDFFALVGRNIPPGWLYGGLAVVAAVYVTLFGLGATAYRTLYANARR